MSYTNVWNDASPTGAEAANTIDDIFRSLKVDIEQRLIDIFGTMPNFTADPLRPYGLKFTDAADSVFYLGDNTGTPRSIRFKDKTGVTTYLAITATSLNLGASLDLSIPSTKKVFLDGGGDTYIYESAANIFRLYVGGVNVLAADSGTINMSGALTSVIIASGAKFYIDGGFDTYLWESSANHITGVAGGVTAFDVTTTTFTLNTGLDLVVQPTKKLFLDGGGDTYIYESSGNIIEFIAGGATVLDLQATLVYARVNFAIDPTNKIYLDGGGDTYLQEASANTLVVVVGGATTINITATSIAPQVAINMNAKLTTKASILSGAGLNIPNGSAPTSPASGDFWYDGTNLKFRDSSTTRTITWT